MIRLAVLLCTVALLATAELPAQDKSSAKPITLEPADLAKLKAKDTTEAEKKAVVKKYHEKFVQFTGRATKTYISVDLGRGFLVEAEAKDPGEVLVLLSGDADFKAIKAIRDEGKMDALLVVEGKALIGDKLDVAVMIETKVLSVKAVAKK